MKIKALRNGEARPSKSGTGSLVWDYEIVDAKPAELALYKKIKGSYYRESDSGKPLYFSSMFVGHTATLQFNRDNTNVYCPEATNARAVVQQARKMGANVDSAFSDVFKTYMGGFMSKPQSTETETVEEKPAKEKAPAKGKTRSKVVTKRRSLSSM